MQVKDYMQAITMTITTSDCLSTARRTMDALFIRHLPVVREGNRLIGILTDRDLRQARSSSSVSVADQESPAAFHEITVNEIMTQRVVTVSPDTTLLEAASIFLEQKFDCLPVVDENGALQGLITVSDFVRAYVEQYENVIF